MLSSILETLSESSSSEERHYSSDFDSSDSFTSESSENSYSNFSPAEEDIVEEDNRNTCIIVSSDEESMELEHSIIPSAPLTPGSQLEQCLQNFSGPYSREEIDTKHYTYYKQDSYDFDAIMKLQSSNPQNYLWLLSPVGVPGCVARVLFSSS